MRVPRPAGAARAVHELHARRTSDVSRMSRRASRRGCLSDAGPEWTVHVECAARPARQNDGQPLPSRRASARCKWRAGSSPTAEAAAYRTLPRGATTISILSLGAVVWCAVCAEMRRASLRPRQRHVHIGALAAMQTPSTNAAQALTDSLRRHHLFPFSPQAVHTVIESFRQSGLASPRSGLPCV